MLADLDALVVNGIGHDDFIFPMLAASGNRKVRIIRPNEVTPQIRSLRGTAVNSHTFISFTNAVQQTYAIEKALAALRPEAAAALQRNAESYARRLRQIKARAAARLADATITRVVTVHDGYGYLLQEFGLEVAGVVQPAHGLTPSAAELRDMIELLRPERIRVVFSEESFPPRLLAVLRGETGVRVYTISHIASGAYTAEKFEREVQRNADTTSDALVTAPRAAPAGRIVGHWRGEGGMEVVPQRFAVDRTLPVTVADFLALTRQRRPVCLGIAAATRARVAALLARVGLAGAEGKALSVLSGGELRRGGVGHAPGPPPPPPVVRRPARGPPGGGVRGGGGGPAGAGAGGGG